MNMTNDLLSCSASEQARLIAGGKLSAAALLAQQLACIAARNPQVNAFVEVLPAPAAETLAASPLAGTSFAVKDNIDVAGVPSHAGLRALHAPAAARDATVVARLRAAGLHCLGKLNMHAVALGASNHNADFGDCHNPRRPGHTPGGSSGGSGAAVAAGFCGIALGTDTMGSVRIPAAYCGVVGFKPSFEALPTDGLLPLSSLLDHIGILARSVEDVVHAFAIVRERDRNAGSVTATAETTAGVGFDLAMPDDLAAMGATDEVRAAFAAALPRLRAAGFRQHALDMAGYPFSATRRAGLLLCEAELNHTLSATLSAHRTEMPADLLSMLDFGRSRSAVDLARATAVVVGAGRWLTRTVAPFDGLLLPTAPQQAFAMDGPVPHHQADFTAMANMSGAPAISLPLPVGDGVLPIGLQLVGHRGRDDTLLRIAAAAEAALR